jgi:orotate phosphoribosyltransferase
MGKIMSKKIANELLKIGAVKFSPNNPFSYASGLKGPIYCDNRMILSHVEFRNLIIEAFLETIKSNRLDFDLIGGIATAGIPHAAFVADRLKCPMVYVRPKPKGHGKMNQVEGDYKPTQKVLLFEDLVNLGSSLEEAIVGTSGAKLIVTDCLCIVDYEMKEAKSRLKNLGLSLYALTNFTDLVEAAFELNLINEDGKNILNNWHSDPAKWSKQFE